MSYFFPEYFRVDMNQEDIDNGVMGSMTKCALVLAVKRELEDLDIMSAENDESRIEFSVETLEEGDTEVWLHNFYFDLDDDIYIHTFAFDLDKTRVKPIKMHFNVTEVVKEEEGNRYCVYGDVTMHEDHMIGEVVPTETQTVVAGTNYIIS